MPRDIFTSTLKLFDGAQPSVCEGADFATWRFLFIYYLIASGWTSQITFKQIKQKKLFKNSMNKCVCSIPVELKDQVMFRLKLFEALMDISRFLLAWKKKKKLCYWAEEWNQSSGTNWLKMENLRDRPKKESARNWSKFLFLSHLFLVRFCSSRCCWTPSPGYLHSFNSLSFSQQKNYLRKHF